MGPYIYFFGLEIFALLVLLSTTLSHPSCLEIIFVEKRPYFKISFTQIFFGLLALVNFLGVYSTASFVIDWQVWILGGVDGIFILIMIRNKLVPISVVLDPVKFPIEF